jgi:hypothetical protein
VEDIVSKIFLSCTDGGQHGLCALGSIRLAGQVLAYMPDENARRTVDALSYCETRTRSDGGLTFVVRCPRCVNGRGNLREKPIRDDKVVQLLAAGVGALDISALP